MHGNFEVNFAIYYYLYLFIIIGYNCAKYLIYNIHIYGTYPVVFTKYRLEWKECIYNL